MPSLEATISNTINSSTSLSLKIRMALTGSPTYLASLKRQVLTRPTRRNSRQGMTRCCSRSKLQKAFQQCHAETMTLFRMKLHPEDIPSLKSGHELSTVIRHCNHVFPL